MKFFPKKVIRKFGPRNLVCFRPQTRCQGSAHDCVTLHCVTVAVDGVRHVRRRGRYRDGWVDGKRQRIRITYRVETTADDYDLRSYSNRTRARVRGLIIAMNMHERACLSRMARLRDQSSSD